MTIPGRISIEPRAIRSVVEAATAETFDAPTKGVRAKVHADGGRLELEIATPYGGAEPLLGAATSGRDAVSARASELTGARFDRVRLRITSLTDIDDRRRVS
ncbi:hypothetical protein [Agrococcus jejuensis]|uniref:Asp23 family, cell envelope-related function n=1 Tax=Agrococcus jejuensis TaxID=399736 RepID=A0A1G8DQE1_9MICO|nr:hypothetical protein [Agrococcus jejuensis]SDH59867.1 hypothetical protein SAMN04489720_1737 [Agrococcus jejuensis]